MAPSPKKYEQLKAEPSVHPAKPSKSASPKKIPNCFFMNTPPKPGMIPVSTDQVKDGCFVLAWQTQPTTMLVTESAQWYAYASQILKANLAFTAIFAIALIMTLVWKRDRP